jgi:DNA mismatch repair protein MutL
MTIKILDNSLINKIAAGEVVERPGSVVKELLENSLDAGATNIKIEIEEAGLRKIKISDNGCGMDKDDLMLSYKRHATSKISNTDDLFHIMSLGFRGEALASIAEVSNLRIQTKTKDNVLGELVEIEAGEVKKTGQCACSTGVIIEVNDLLFNVPARKKYLKSPEIEFNYILKTITKYALIRKDVAFKLIKDGKEVLRSKQSEDLLNNIIYVYGAGIAKDLIEVDYEEAGLKIHGFISKPNLTRSDKNDQSLYVNNRYIKNQVMSNSIYEAYKTLLFIHRHPVFVLNVDISPDEIDVNVHPSKEIIRLKDEGAVSKIVFNAISNSFKRNSLIPNANLEEESIGRPLKVYPFKTHFQSNLETENESVVSRESLVVSEGQRAENKGQKTGGKEQSTVDRQLSTVNENKKEGYGWQIEKKDIVSQPSDVSYQSSDSKKIHKNFGPFVVMGQVNQSFIIAKSPQGLVVIDQHAAEERVNYEKFMKERIGHAIKTQSLLTPKIVELNPFQHRTAMSNQDFIRSLGYDFEDFGDNTIKLSAVPEIFGRMKSILFVDIINELEKGAGSLKPEAESISNSIEERIIRFACRASIKAGDELTAFQMRELLVKLELCDNPFTCPHGRPTIINFTIGDLEKKFKRK